MKALLLGGSGFFGGHVLRQFQSKSPISEIIVASRSSESASKAAERANIAARAAWVDIDDPNSLFRAVTSVDLVLNAAGNATETAPKVIRAAMQAGRPYVDLSAEVDVLLSAEKLIAELGVPDCPIVLGAGAHPGMTEFLGMRAARELDHVDRVDMFLIAALKDYGPVEQFQKMFEQGWNGVNGLQTFCKFPGMTAVIIDGGGRQFLKPKNATTEISTPEGELISGFALATAEPLALTRAMEAGFDSSMNMSFWPPDANEIAQAAAPGFLNGGEQFAPVLEEMWKTIPREMRPHPRIHFWATAMGKKKGKTTTVSVFSPQDWGNQPGVASTTARMMAYTAEAIARGEVKKPGLLSPVDIFEPDDVFTSLAAPEEPEIQVKVQ